MVNQKEKKVTPNKAQQKAIDILKGQVMLLAGPGTGKTFTVIHRIEKMLNDGKRPDSILCLTFSDAAANEMRQRLIKKMGVLASAVDIYTYHSFCNEIIKEYPHKFELASGVTLINKTQQIALMKETIDEVEPKTFIPTRADKYHFVNQFISHLQHLKDLRIKKDEYLSNIDTNPTLMPRIKELESEIYEREQRGETRNKGRYDELEKIKKNIEKAKELWDIFEVYSRKMLENNLIDFSDMICFVLEAFENDENFKHEVSNKYQYFLVDEYQDTNDLQNNIIFSLVDSNKEQNIFVVGDDDQIIYGFQGAKNDNIENFLQKYPNTEVICLTENNRSTQTILDFAYNLVCQDETRLEFNESFKQKNITKKLTAKNEDIIANDKKIRRIQFGDTLQEFNYNIDDIKSLVNSECCPTKINEKTKEKEKDLSQIAIISKKRETLHSYAEMLKGKNIPCQIDEGKNIFNVRSSILMYFYMKALVNNVLYSDKLFGLLLSEPFKISQHDYKTLLKLHGETKLDFISLIRQTKEWQVPQKIETFIKTFDDLKVFAQTNNLRNIVIEIAVRTGILEAFYRLEKNRMENISGIKRLIDEATQFSSTNKTAGLNDFVQYLEDCLNNDIEISLDKDKIIQNAVQLTTYHGSKGREFEYVYLPNLTAKAWENFAIRSEYKFITDEVLDEETANIKKDSELLKLLFVGVTRAKHGLTLTFADNEDGKAQQITKYLTKFADYNFDSKQFEYNEDNFTQEFVRSISYDVFDNQKAFKDTLKQRVEKISLSPSRLNDYISCPRKFFYLKVLGIDVEDSNWDNANFGTLMHSLLEKSVKYAKETGNYYTKEEISEMFNAEIQKTTFSADEHFEKFKRLGLEAIEKYYPHFAEIPVSRITDVEYEFKGLEFDGHTLTGKIDRIEKNSDGTYELYDYKTGTAVSEKQISLGGKKEGYYNQLCFYKYAFERLTNKTVSKTGIIYVEENKTIQKELDCEDIDYIKEKIKQVIDDIEDLKFTPKQDNDNCKHCQYKQLCQLDVI